MNKYYWKSEMDDYITQYNSTEDIEERNIIYNNHLYQPMMKMAESIFNRFKFGYIEYEPQDVLMDVVSHLTSKLNSYDKKKGKSYSWASITIKFWLINNNNNTFKYRKNTDSLNSIISDNTEVIDITESPDMINDQHLLIDSMWNEWDNIVDYYNKHPKVGKVGPSWMKILHGTDKVIKSKSDKKECIASLYQKIWVEVYGSKKKYKSYKIGVILRSLICQYLINKDNINKSKLTCGENDHMRKTLMLLQKVERSKIIKEYRENQCEKNLQLLSK